MKRLLYIFIVIMLPLQMVAANIGVYDIRTENLKNPEDIDITTPRFSWKISSDGSNIVQTGYQIIVASSPEKLDEVKADLWNSGKVESANQLWIEYRGKALKSNDEAFWRVRVFTNKGKSEWSQVQHFGMALLGENRWKGQWIGLEELQPGEQRGLHTRLAVRYLRKEFKTKKIVRRAMAYVVGLGLYDFYVNGKQIGDNQVLKPVPSDYRKTVYYNTFDITRYIQSDNAIGISLAAGRYFPMRQEKYYKSPVFGLPKCRINILVEYQDGTKETWATDQSWKLSFNGPIRNTNEYDGEEYDARMEMSGWNSVGFDDSKWIDAVRTSVPEGELRAQMTPCMVEQRYGNPISMMKVNGKYILDFGQNMAGWIGFMPRGEKGDSIKVRYAEKLNSDGSIYTANLRNANSTDIYVCNGKEQGHIWKPTFVYHGFRYAEVSNLATAKKEDFTAFTVGDDMQATGELTTSDTILNKVILNAFWGIKSNYKGMPVDCPQRNERQPWLGDRTVGCLGESYLFDNERLYAKWMHDLSDGVRYDGAMSNVTPSFWNYYEDNMTWPAVFPFACDMLYEQYGNSQPIINSYPSIRKWLMYMLNEYETDGIITKDKYGDWCVPPEKLQLIHSEDPSHNTDGQLISTAYGVRILQLMEKFAKLQNMNEDARLWESKRKEMTDAFNHKFLTVKRGTSLRPGHVLYPDSVFYGNNTATANLLPLAFGIVPDSIKAEVVKNVVTNIISVGDGHVTCGVIGISWLLRSLSDNGFSDVAYLLATNKTYPSWGYMAENGATTIWELWNGDKADAKMNSGNHVMLLGDLLTWCYKYLGGISQAENSVAYKHIILKPSFDIEDCFNVNASYETPYGKVVSKWDKTLQKLHWNVEIPVNTTATLYMPNGKTEEVGSGRYSFNVEIPTRNTAIIKDEFLYENATFPEAHASTITELKNGDLVASYFGGTKERNPDVCIWVSRKPKGADKWEAPIMAGDGVFQLGTADAELAGVDAKTTPASAGPTMHRKVAMSGTLKRKACWNPVLFTMPDGEIWLFYKVGATVDDWTGWLVKSRDGGKTWTEREPLPKGFIGPVKNKPELINDRLICGSSTEKNGWRFHVEILDLKTGKWKYVGFVDAEKTARTDDVVTASNMANPVYKEGKGPEYIYSIQPSILKLKDGRLQVLMRTHNAKLATSFSSDNGDTWSKVTLTDVPNNQSGTDAVTLKDGRHVLIYNDFETIPGTKKGPRTPLSIAISDDGTHWRHVLTLEDSPVSQYSYPAIIQGKDGNLHCVYTWRRQLIAYKKIDLSKLK